MEDLTQLAYSVDTLYFLLMGVLVMFMAPGFAMLEAGMVRAKNTSEILTKNVALFAIAIFGMLSALAVFDQAWLVGGILVALTMIVSFRSLRESSAATNAVMHVVKEWGDEG